MKKIQFAIILAVSMLAAGSACAQKPTPKAEQNAEQKSAQQCQPVQSGAANAPEQKPAFQGQTRVCAVQSKDPFQVTVVAKGLDKPWAVEPLPDGSFLITEKAGRMRIVTANGQVGEPIAG